MLPRLVLCASLIAVPLGAQEQLPDTAHAAPVIVTATRLPLSQSTLPVSVTVITGDELRLRGVTTVADAIADVTSAYVAQSGSQGATTSLFLRGGESKYVKVLIDGVPANDPGGSYDFASLTTDNVERIEIVRGPASVIYGADAVTGVVHIITRHGAGAPRITVDVRGGAAPRDRVYGGASDPASMRQMDATVGLTGAVSSGAYTLSVARHQSSGLYEINNGFQDNVLSGHLQFAPTSGMELRVALRYTDYQFDYPTNSGGTPDSVGAYDRNAKRTEDRTVLGVEIEQAVTARVRGVIALSSSVNDGGTDDALDAPGGNSYLSQDKTRRRGAELRLHVSPVSRTAFTLGAQLERQDQRSQSQGQFSVFPFTSSFAAARRNTGAYVEAVAAPVPSLTATVGGRWDDNEQFGTFTTGRVGISWRPLAATRLRLTAGSAFREPTFAENYSTGFVTGNPQLQPERSRSIDGGVDQDLFGGRATLALTGFAQRFRDMIDYTGNTASCGYSYCNVAAARASGLEAELDAALMRPVRASLGGTWLTTRVTSPGFDVSTGGLYREGESLIRRPARTLTTQLSYRGASRFSGNLRVLAVGKRQDRDFRPFPATPVTLAGYERVDVGAEYALPSGRTSRSALTLRIENLTNTGYQSVFNYLSPRRTVSVGVRSTF